MTTKWVDMTVKLKWFVAICLWVFSIWLMTCIGVDYGFLIWLLNYILVIAMSAVLVYGVVHYELVQRIGKWMVRDGK